MDKSNVVGLNSPSCGSCQRKVPKVTPIKNVVHRINGPNTDMALCDFCLPELKRNTQMWISAMCEAGLIDDAVVDRDDDGRAYELRLYWKDE